MGVIDPAFPNSQRIVVQPDDVKVTQPYSLADLCAGDMAGTTETDSKTDPKGSGGYSKINSK